MISNYLNRGFIIPLCFKIIEITLIVFVILFYPMRPFAFIIKAISYYGFAYVIIFLAISRLYDEYFDDRTEIIISALGFIAFMLAGGFILYQAKHEFDPQYDDDEKASYKSAGILSVMNSFIFLISFALHMFSIHGRSMSQHSTLFLTKILELIGIVIAMCLHPNLYSIPFIVTGTVFGFGIILSFLIIAFLSGVRIQLNSKILALALGSILFVMTGCVFLMEARDIVKRPKRIIFHIIGGLSVLNGCLFIVDALLTAKQ